MKKTKWIIAAFVACAIVLAGCKNSSEPDPIAVESVTLSETTLTLAPGATKKLTAMVKPDNADDKTVTWQSSDEKVATIKDGTVTAVAKGTATITARAGGKEAKCEVVVSLQADTVPPDSPVTVNPVAVESVTLDMKTLALTPGMTDKLAATVMPENANDKTVKWSSSDEKVAAVGNDGTVTAVSEGTATITAQSGDKTATCAVTVKLVLIAIEGITLDMDTLTPGTTKQLIATVKPDNADNKTVKWSSSDEKVATVNSDGTVTAIKVGTTTITAQAGGKTATCEITVTIPDVEGFEIDEYGVLTKYTGNNATVVIPDGVTSIGDNAFYGCKNLTNVTIPSSVTSIGYRAFSGCPRETVTYKGTLAQWCAMSNDWTLFEAKYVTMGDGTDLKTMTTLVIPDGVTSIGNYAFHCCTNLTNVIIPNSVTSIGNCTFDSCTNLASVMISEGVTSIGKEAFEYCPNLTDVTIPASVTSIGKDAFWTCENIKTVRYEGTLAQWCGITWESQGSNPLTNSSKAVLYIGGEAVTDMVIPSGVTEIKAFAFMYYTSLKSVTIPASVTSVGEHAFHSYGSLTTVRYEGTLTQWCDITWEISSSNPLSHGKAMLYIDGKAVTDIVIPRGMTEIKCSAFYGYEKLETVTIPKSMKSIGDGAFGGCKNLVVRYEGTLADWCAMDNDYGLMYYAKHVTMNDGSDNEIDLKEMRELSIPVGVKTIAMGAFSYCGFTSVTIPNSVTSIGYCAFMASCGEVTNLTIGGGVASIGESAFLGCNSATYKGTEQEWNSITILGSRGSGLGGKTITGVDENGNTTTWTAKK